MIFEGQSVTKNELLMITKIDVAVALFHLFKYCFLHETSHSVTLNLSL